MMTPKLTRALLILFGHEGDYVNDPRDPGGETRYGISKRSYPHVDIKTLTVERASLIYAADYWAPMKCDLLPPTLALLVFDCAVNCGVGQAVKWLQQAAQVKVDGQLGAVTLAACGQPDVARRFHLIRVIAMTRMRNWPDFSKGWSIRLASLPFDAQEYGARYAG